MDVVVVAVNRSELLWNFQKAKRPSQLDTQPVRNLIPFATQLDTKLDSQHVRDPSQRQSVRYRQQPVRDSTISARDLSNGQFQPATISKQSVRGSSLFGGLFNPS
ncbi:hypothetical protein DY000_02053471 [Brassica cretica]|uniref:Uncharacterized protein n=1 Tax=Brassica cretica TaxID=69181 RepID=A0ABQ7ADU7_BRACR|nr:hypothetical protein DY000_02053471 [Brassica cretica]